MIFAAVICPAHGSVPISEEEYDKQMARPSSRWVCTKCGSVAEFDDEEYERLHPYEE